MRRKWHDHKISSDSKKWKAQKSVSESLKTDYKCWFFFFKCCFLVGRKKRRKDCIELFSHFEDNPNLSSSTDLPKQDRIGRTDLERASTWQIMKEDVFRTNTTSFHFPHLPFPKRKTAVGTVEARWWGIVDVCDLRPWRTLKTKNNLNTEKVHLTLVSHQNTVTWIAHLD